MLDLDEIVGKEIFGISDEEEYRYPALMQLIPEDNFDDEDDEDDDDDLEDEELDENIRDDDEEIIHDDDDDDDDEEDAGLSKEYF
ncbi:MAG: hypothetical protein ABSF32_07950 [Ignavibacteria bacterium]|jgi:hypothetical protein